VSLLEILVTLSILSLVLAVVIPSLRPQTDRLVLERQSHDLSNDLFLLRDEAMKTGQVQVLQTNQACEAETAEIKAFPNGFIVGPDLCLTSDAGERRMRFDRVTGRLAVELP